MRAELKDGRAVLDDLQEIDAIYVATIRPNQNAAERIDHHRIFLLLYYYSTVRWVELAETSNLPLTVNQVIVEFYRRYREYVFEPVVGNAVCRASHWQAYFKQGDIYLRRPGHISRLRLLNYGVYAHARYDLAEAIATALGAGDCTELSQAEQEIIGSRSAQIFIGAARDFLLNCERVLPEIGLSFGRRSFWLYVQQNTWWWFPRFQRWREAAWADAMILLEAGRTRFTETEIRQRLRER